MNTEKLINENTISFYNNKFIKIPSKDIITQQNKQNNTKNPHYNYRFVNELTHLEMEMEQHQKLTLQLRFR